MRLTIWLSAPLGTLVLSIVLLASPGPAQAVMYPGNQCVGSKQRAAGVFCEATLTAWSRWDRTQDAARRDAAIAKAAQRLALSWANAEHGATAMHVDCTETTLSAPSMQALLDGTISAVVTDVNAGLDLAGNTDHASCGAALLRAAATDCAALLRAEVTYVAKLAAGKTRRNTAQAVARGRFRTAFANATAHSCPTLATDTAIASTIDGLVSTVVTNTIVSPRVDNTQFMTIAPTGSIVYQGRSFTPSCSRNTPYYFFVKRGSVNKLLMYYQGGGACWDYFTCNLPTFDESVNPSGSDNPNYQSGGFADLGNPDNPFRDWNIVFTSYCTGDIHFGDTHQDYDDGGGALSRVNHYGYQNSRVVEKWAREHFVNPDEVFVTGSSAGAYGAFFNAPLLQEVWPDSKFTVLADAGNGIITTDFLQGNFPTWDFEKNIPTYIPGVLDAIHNGTGIPAYTHAVAAYFPNTAWAHYTTAYDGGTGGQTGFYNVMLNPMNPSVWGTWWHASCQWHDAMVQQALDTAAAVTTGNYRYYIGRGSRHTGWGSSTVVYNADTIGGTPALKDWTTSMRNRDAGWVNVECGDCETTLTGDPLPNPLRSPFQRVGSTVEIVCP